MSESSFAGARTRRCRLAASIFGVMLLAALPASALGVSRPSETISSVADSAARVSFDSRSEDRAGVRDVQRASRAAGSLVRSARADELKRLGAGGKIQLDALTGTPRTYQNLSGTLSGSSGGSPAAAALGFARSRAAVLGLSGADLDALGAPKVVDSPSGINSVRFTQSYKGIPAYDNDLRINLDRVNRVLSVTGSPVHGLSVASVTPKLSAKHALSALMSQVGVRRDVSVKTAGSDARRTTRFSTDDTAKLVLFHTADGTRLAWHLTYQANSQAWFDAVVDATTGDVLRRSNLVKNVDVDVFENYPGDVNGGTQQTVDLGNAYVTTGAPVLAGQYARTFNDLDTSDAPETGEEVTPGQYAFDPFTAAEAPNGFCLALKPCGWDPDTPGSWTTNMNEAAVQAHYYVSKFHDHLLASPIGFDSDDGNFEGADRVIVNVNEGAASGPNLNYVNTANMVVRPDGMSPRMQLSVFKVRGMGIYRAINAADDARTVYHEYTHGLSNRLVTNDGTGALNSVQGAALGEGWSDWYALDYLEAQGLENDTATIGELDMGEYLDGTPHITRFSPLDCPPDAGGSNCDGGVDTGGAGGFTYADFGHICCTASDIRPEVHSDGEIWAQTLWDLRTSLGSTDAQQLITDGMRLTPPEPSFLDARNAILAADAAAPSNGANRDAIWQVFAARGMGFYASAESGSDANPVANFSTPPSPGTPDGSIAGRVTDIDTGLPIAGALVGVAGHITDPSFPDYLAATSGADGRYTISDVPEGGYPLVAIPPTAGYDPIRFENVTVTAGETTTRNAALRRDWAASRGGAQVDGNDDALSVVACGQINLVDQSLASGTLSYSPSAAPPGFPANPHVGEDPYIVVELPKAITVDSFAVDPGDTCGGDPTTVTKDYSIETSQDGVAFAPAKQGAFAPADAHRLNLLTPTANSTNVKYVKITSHSAQNEDPSALGHHIYALAELEVYGTTPNVLPSGTLSTSPAPVTTGQVVTLTAAFTDPDSAITGYDWDFDGNGSVDHTTTDPTTTTSYPTAGNRVVTVAAQDFRGGAGSASTYVSVTSPPASLPALPILTLNSPGTRGRTVFSVRCFSACRVTAKVTLDSKTAKRLGLKVRTVSSGIRTIRPGKTTSVTIRLTSKVVKAMRRHRVTRLKGTLRATATYSDGRRTVASRKVSVRR